AELVSVGHGEILSPSDARGHPRPIRAPVLPRPQLPQRRSVRSTRWASPPGRRDAAANSRPVLPPLERLTGVDWWERSGRSSGEAAARACPTWSTRLYMQVEVKVGKALAGDRPGDRGRRPAR